MQAVILAAGKSTRTYPLTITKPKPLLKIANKTILEHNLESLSGIIDEVIIVIGYKGDMIKEMLGNKFKNIKISYAEQKDMQGSGSALLAAGPMIKDKFIVMNGDDIFFREDIKKCLKHDYCILAKETSELSRFGEVMTDKEKVTGLREKPAKDKGLANCGLYVFNKDIFSYKLKKSIRGEFEITDYVNFAAKKNKMGFEIAESWLPVTYPWNILDANEFLLAKIKGKSSGEIENGATIKGEVIVGKGSVVKAGSYIEGPVMIGENCKIGPNCYIRKGTSVGNNSKIGNAVEVKNSVIGDNTSIGHLSYVGDSVIGDNVNFGAGTITANLRHDDKNIKTPVKGSLADTGRRKLGTIIGDNVHTGINTSIYPGRKIWPGRSTVPGEIIMADSE